MPRHPGPEPGSCVLGLCYNGCGRKVVREPGNCFVRHVKESFTAPTRGGTISSHGWFLSMPPNLPLEGRAERQAFAKAQAIRVGVAVPDFKSMGMGDSLPPPGSATLLRPPLKGEVGHCFAPPQNQKRRSFPRRFCNHSSRLRPEHYPFTTAFSSSRPPFMRSATRKASSRAWSALRRGSQWVW